jgi:hypothetical protein
LLWQREGFESLEQWCDSESARVFRRLVLCASSWVHAHHFCTYVSAHAWPWRLALLIDTRLQLEERKSIARTFLKSNLCDLDPYFSKRLREKHPDLTCEELFGNQWQRFFSAWAFMVGLTVSQIEDRHARNRKKAAPGMAWSHFASMFVNSEATCQMNARMETISRTMAEDSSNNAGVGSNSECSGSATNNQEGPGVGNVAGEIVAMPTFSAIMSHVMQVRKAMSPFEVFRKEWSIATHAGLRVPMSISSSGFWEAIQEEYRSLPRDRFDSLKTLADLSKVFAKQNRARELDRKRQAESIQTMQVLPVADSPNQAIVPFRNVVVPFGDRGFRSMVCVDSWMQMPNAVPFGDLLHAVCSVRVGMLFGRWFGLTCTLVRYSSHTMHRKSVRAPRLPSCSHRAE